MTDTPPPLPVTYWVVPGRFLAGPQPLVIQETSSPQHTIETFVSGGINAFIDLTYPAEMLGHTYLTHPRADDRPSGYPLFQPSDPGFRVTHTGSDAGHPGPDQEFAGRGQQHLSALLWRDRAHRHGGGLLPGGTGDDRQPGAGADQIPAEGPGRMWMPSPETRSQREFILNWKK